jgi:hypothetical protein
MSGMKRFAEEVMVEMGKEEIDDEVLAEAQRRVRRGLDGERLEQFWISYTVRTNGGVQFSKTYDTGHSMKCKWTSFIHDLENHADEDSWRIVEESEERKVVAYNDQLVAMTVFQLVTISALVEIPEVIVAIDPVSVGQCIKDGTHLTDCDDDGYCNFCGEQEG